MADSKLAYIPNDSPELFAISTDEAEKNIIEILSSIVKEFPPSEEWGAASTIEGGLGGLYCGPSGLALV